MEESLVFQDVYSSKGFVQVASNFLKSICEVQIAYLFLPTTTITTDDDDATSSGWWTIMNGEVQHHPNTNCLVSQVSKYSSLKFKSPGKLKYDVDINAGFENSNLLVAPIYLKEMNRNDGSVSDAVIILQQPKDQEFKHYHQSFLEIALKQVINYTAFRDVGS